MGNYLRSGWEVLVRSPNPEGLLNRLAEGDVRFEGVERIDEVTLYLQVTHRDIRDLRRIAEGSGSELLLCRPFGLRLRVSRLGRRTVLVVALAVCAVLLAVSNLFVWRIEVSGNETVPTGAILRAVTEAGGGIGSFWPAFNGEQMRTEILLALDEVQWVAVNYRAGAIQVVVREKREVPEVVDNDAPYHVVAEKAGVLTNLSVKMGQPHVAKGDTVEEGQLLISGAAVSGLGTTRTVHALGNAEARTWYTISARQPAYALEKAYTGRESLKISLILGTKRINFYSDSSIFEDSCDTITMDYHLCMDDVFSMPVRILVQRCVYHTARERTLDAQVQEELAQYALMEELKRRIGEDGSVTTVSYAATSRESGMTVTLMAECLEEIGEEVPISAEELQQIQGDNSSREEATDD